MINEIYKGITKKRFNRESPTFPSILLKNIEDAVSKKQPIEIMALWGIGHKPNANWAEEETCLFLDKLNAEVKKIYPNGLSFHFIIAVPHAIHNGVKSEFIKSYVKSIKILFKKHNFKWLLLDKLWKKHSLDFEKIDVCWKKKPENWWDKLPNSNVLEALAKVRNHRLPARTAAQKYVVMRDLEKEIFELEFSNCVFYSYTSSKFDYLLPLLPILHLYSYKKGRSESPWFVYD